jgi:magnesium transporter
LIPASHLALVAVGVVTLLGGVWVVSIHSGGGGVEVGAWTSESGEAGEDVSETGSILQDHVSEAPHSPHVVWGTNSEPYIGPDAEGGTSETPMSPLSTATYPLPSTSQPQSDRSKKRFLYYNRHPAFDVRGSPSGHSRRHHSYSFGRLSATSPLSNSTHNTISSLASAGFQIGLSPLSPGFTILPLERRLSHRDGETGIDPERDPTEDTFSHRRRTVSESDTRRKSRDRTEDTTEESSSAQALLNTADDDSPEVVGAGERTGRLWKTYIPRLFTRK